MPRERLYFTLLVTLALVVANGLGSSPQRQVRSAVYRRFINNFTCSQDLVFQQEVRSKEDCAHLCMADCTCVYFTYRELVSGISICRGHDHPSAYNGMTHTPGATLFRLDKNREDWHGKTCLTNSDCPVALSECFEGTCLCTPGIYYSNSSNTCVETCEECALRPEFVEYDRRAIWGSMAARHTSMSRTDCLNTALTDPLCRSVTYDNASMECNIHHLTAADISSGWKTGLNDSDHFQKTCV